MLRRMMGTIPMLLILISTPCYSDPTAFSLQYWKDSGANEQIVFTLPERFWEYTDLSHWVKYSENRFKFSLLLPPGTKLNTLNTVSGQRWWQGVRVSLEKIDQFDYADGPCGGTTPETGRNQKRLLQQAKTDQDAMAMFRETEELNVVMGGLVKGPIKVAYALSDCQGDVEPDELISYYDGDILFVEGDDIVSLSMEIPILDKVKVSESEDYLKKLKNGDSRVATGKTWQFFVKVARSIEPNTAKK